VLVAPADLWIVTGVTVVLLGLVFFFFIGLYYSGVLTGRLPRFGVPVFAMDTSLL